MWQFAVLPFGLNSAPFIFTKLMKPVVATLRKLGIRVVLYLVDMLIMANSQNKARDHCQWAIYLLMSLGFILNMEKSMWFPRQQIEFLGFRLDSKSDYFTASTETDDLVENNKTSSREDTGIIERNIPGSGNNGSDTSSHLTSPTTLQTPGKDQNTLPQSWCCFR